METEGWGLQGLCSPAGEAMGLVLGAVSRARPSPSSGLLQVSASPWMSLLEITALLAKLFCGLDIHICMSKYCGVALCFVLPGSTPERAAEAASCLCSSLRLDVNQSFLFFFGALLSN